MRRIKGFGGQHKTLPIKNPKLINELMYYLQNKIQRTKTNIKKYQADRNYIMILIGLNTAFRAEDLLQLRVVDVIKGYISIKENKTGKTQNFRMKKELHEDIQNYISKYKLLDYDYMFRGQKKKVNGKAYIYPITRQMGYKIVNDSGKAVGIDFVFGLHSLRKTFGYQYINNGGNILTLMKMYNHSSTIETQMYVMWGNEDAEEDRTKIYIGGVHRKGKKSKNNVN